jgi:hypothetical protein
MGPLVACSQDKHVFRSTSDLPTTIALYDTAADRTIWVKDIPVSYKLVLDFDRKGEVPGVTAPARPATSVRWTLYAPDRLGGVESEKIELPGNPLAIKVSYRPIPEYPPGYREAQPPAKPSVTPPPAAAPAAQPAAPVPSAGPESPPQPVEEPQETETPAQDQEPAPPAAPATPETSETPETNGSSPTADDTPLDIPQ